MITAGGCLLLSGCATHSRSAGTAVAKLRTGNPEPALHWAERLKTSRLNHPLGYVESGRIKMLTGDFEGSRQDFTVVIDEFLEETETGPVIRVSSAAATAVAATVTDDTQRPYQLAPYETIQLLHYQTLNYLFSGDPGGAGVEMRRTVFVQDAVAEQYAAKHPAGGKEEKADEAHAGAEDAVQARLSAMGPVLERTRSSYENGLAWYFCGLLFEMQGDTANASLSYRKARELAPDNRVVRTDFMRMLRTQDPLAFAELAVRYPTEAKNLSRSETGLVVLYEEGLISLRHAEKIPLPIPDFRGAITYISIDFPLYQDGPWVPSPLALSAGGRSIGVAEPAVYLQSLAYRDLKDKMPGITLRNITRAVTKVGAQQVANHQNNANLQMAMMAVNLLTAFSTTADTRAWYTLPMGTYLYRGDLAPGTYILEVRRSSAGGAVQVPVTVTEGETRLVWIADTGGTVAAATASLTGKGLPPTFQQSRMPSNDRIQ